MRIALSVRRLSIEGLFVCAAACMYYERRGREKPWLQRREIPVLSQTPTEAVSSSELLFRAVHCLQHASCLSSPQKVSLR